MKAPPISGPQTEAMPYILPSSAAYLARFSTGTDRVIMMKLPAKIPADPTPAMARPMIKAVEFGAAPQIADPSSKMMMATR